MEKTAPTPTPPTQDVEAPDTPVKQSSVVQKWTQTLSTTHADLICLLLCFLTGLCDSSAYNAWSCFLGMQTGMNHRRKGRSPSAAKHTTLTKNRKHHFPRPRRLQPTIQQTMGLAKVPRLNPILLLRRDGLLNRNAQCRCPAPRNSLRLILRPNAPHRYRGRSHRSRSHPSHLRRRRTGRRPAFPRVDPDRPSCFPVRRWNDV